MNDKQPKSLMELVRNENLTPEQAWDKKAQEYAGRIQMSEYHRHRLRVLDAIIPQSLYQPGQRIFDFGCGDAVHFEQFLSKGCVICGVDISGNMIAIAKERLQQNGYDPQLANVGGIAALADLQDASMDAILCFNVLAYLTTEEDRTFYRQAQRVLKPGGHLLVTHSNELFDLYSLNQYTVEFFKKHLIRDPAGKDTIHELLAKTQKDGAVCTFNIRENPLAYRYKLAQYGLVEQRQEFINLHSAPPLLLSGERHYPDTLSWPQEDRWKLMFICSTFASVSCKSV